ncbi:hypothetical protein [Caballeronia grimmiae]|uniref:hypothetical protein n=1 Tax=Caballeronia grimmiae TaxID=1071679 RepID=UPI0038B79310
MLSWVLFGDRHASNDGRYQRLGHPASMIQLVNRYLSDRSTVTARTADGRSAEDSILLQGASHADQHLERHPAPMRMQSNPGRSTASSARSLGPTRTDAIGEP